MVHLVWSSREVLKKKKKFKKNQTLGGKKSWTIVHSGPYGYMGNEIFGSHSADDGRQQH